MLSADVCGCMRQIILAMVLILAAVVGPVGAQVDYEYTPPDEASIEELAAVYNANLEAVPWWLRSVLPRGDGGVVIVSVFEDPDMGIEYTGRSSQDIDRGSDSFILYLDGDGRVRGLADVDEFPRVQRDGERVIITTSAATMDAILTAEDPAAVAQAAYRDGSLLIESEGNVIRGMIIWMGRLFW
ncbi:UNVERIFIED_CONTAM: hypothetical protein BEN50_23575 [Euhalothece sp. KZN 001]